MEGQSWNECVSLIKSDAARLRQVSSLWGGVKLLFANPSFKVTFWYRIGHWLYFKHSFWRPLYFLVKIIHRHYEYKTGIQFSLVTNIGPGLMFCHFSCIVINSGVVIGKNCTIMQGVTIGSVRGKSVKMTIGDNVFLGAGSKLMGASIGNNVVVGANSVITKDIPDNVVVAGIPARIISNDALKHLRNYIKQL